MYIFYKLYVNITAAIYTYTYMYNVHAVEGYLETFDDNKI